MLPSEGYRLLARAFQQLDIDITAAISTEQAKPLVTALGLGFYADTDMIRKDEFHQIQFTRRFEADLTQAGLSATTHIGHRRRSSKR